MSLTKKLANFLAPEDKPHQCAKSAKCHRRDKHEGPCRTLAYAVATNLETAAKDLVAGLRERWRQS